MKKAALMLREPHMSGEPVALEGFPLTPRLSKGSGSSFFNGLLERGRRLTPPALRH